MNLIRQMKTMTNCGKRELYLTSSIIHMLHITVQPNLQQLMMSLCSSKVESPSNSIHQRNTSGLGLSFISCVILSDILRI